MSKISDNEALAFAVQTWLGIKEDGWGGVTTMAEFLAKTGQVPAAKVRHALMNPAAFFAAAKAVTGGLTQGQVDGFNSILKAIPEWPVSWAAYALATAYHETAATMQPIAEYGRGKGRKYGAPGRNKGQVAYGRGYVQLTWDDNYERADREIGAAGKLVENYDLALQPDTAADIMREGMSEGWFTGKALKDYLPGDYVNARRIINGTDKAQTIAGYAVKFEKALTDGGW